MAGRIINTLHWVDYIVFALVLAISAGIGIFYGCTGGKQKTTGEFLMANRQMHVIPVTLSLLASFMSAITLLGTPAEVYRFGTQYWMIWIGYVIMIPLAAHVYIPVFFRIRITSVFEYLELRFSQGVRLCCSVAYIIQMVLYMAIVLYAPSLALSAVSGLNVWISVFSVGIVCTFYTTLGGMKAVMWTDTFQILLMFAGLMAVLIQGSIDQKGFGNIWRIMEEGKRVEFFNFDLNPLERHTTWGVVFGGAFTWLAIYGVNQAQVQRAVAVPKLRQAQMALWLNLFGLTALLTICGLCGCVVYAEYRNCDPLTAKTIQASDQLLPLYVMDRLAYIRGLPGLFTACLFSGALSTISSGLNSLSAVTLQDFVRGVCFKNMSEARATTVSKILAIVYGAICLALTFVAAELGGVLQAALALFGMIGGPQLGVYTLGIVFPWTNNKGAYLGFFTGLIFSFWLGIGAQIYKPVVHPAPVSIDGCFSNISDAFSNMTTLASVTLSETTMETVLNPAERAGYLSFYGISYIWYGLIAVGVTVSVGLITSFITGPTNPQDLDPRLVCPLVDTFCCYLPKGIREKLRCGIDHTYDDENDDGDIMKQDHKSTLAHQKPSEDEKVINAGYVNTGLDMEDGLKTDGVVLRESPQKDRQEVLEDVKETLAHSSQADLLGGYTNPAADKSIDWPLPPIVYYESYI